jgi:uncharacterized protein YecA (UPF0149 family)
MQSFTNCQTGEHALDFYKAATQAQLQEKMARGANARGRQGFTLVRRAKVGRNEPCPCNSGRKFKKCCLSKAA